MRTQHMNTCSDFPPCTAECVVFHMCTCARTHPHAQTNTIPRPPGSVQNTLSHTNVYPCALLTHTPTMQYRVYNLQYTVLSDTSPGQHVFEPVAREHSPQTVSETPPQSPTGVGLCVCCLWQRCRLISLPPARLRPPSRSSYASLISPSFDRSPVARRCRLYLHVSPSLRLASRPFSQIHLSPPSFPLSQFLSPPRSTVSSFLLFNTMIYPSVHDSPPLPSFFLIPLSIAL